MKILIVHNYYREPGGEDQCARGEASLLEKNGHEVCWFTLDNADLRPGLGSALRSLWSQQSYIGIRDLIRRERPDIAHFHNTSHLVTPAGYWAAAAEGVAVVQTLHNYRLLCCNALLFRQDKPCEACLGKRMAWSGVRNACYRGSAAASFGVAAATALHRALGTWRERIDAYIAPSEFLRSKFIAAGFPADRIAVKPNFVYPDPGVGLGDGGFALFVGRLSREKGLSTLLDAWELLGPEFALKIVGDGPLATQVSRAARRPNVDWLGRKTQAEVLELMGRARYLIMPSLWYENFPMVIAEAMAKGTPVIVSNVGAPVELVVHERNGFHFQVGDHSDLARVIRQAFGHASSSMRLVNRREYESKYTGSVNHELITSIYARAILARARRRSPPPQPLTSIRRDEERSLIQDRPPADGSGATR